MDKIAKKIIIEELQKLKYKEVMYEGEVSHLVQKACYEYNMLNVDVKKVLDKVYKELYD